MGYSNGRLPSSALSPIAGGYLAHRPAAAWNAMNVESRRRFGVTILPAGSLSSYRNIAGQVYLYARSRPGWAARPGTSNHGWGTTVDLMTQRMRSIINQIGRKYGFSKACSDASWEWWHIKYNPGCTGATWSGKDPGPNGNGAATRLPTLKKGYVKPRKYTRLAQRLLKRAGYPSVCHPDHYGKWDRYTRVRLKRFQKRKGIRADGVLGPKTWRKLLKYRKK